MICKRKKSATLEYKIQVLRNTTEDLRLLKPRESVRELQPSHITIVSGGVYGGHGADFS